MLEEGKPEVQVATSEDGPEPSRAALRRLINKLPIKKRKYVRALIDGMKKTEAARSADFTESMALNARQRIESPDVREVLDEFHRIMDAEISKSDVVKGMKAGLKAKKAIPATKDGMVTHVKYVPDMPERRLARQQYLDVRGLTSQKVEVSGINYDQGTLDTIAQMAAKILDLPNVAGIQVAMQVVKATEENVSE